MRRIEGKQRQISPGFSVNRILPSLAARSVGPFVFFDAFGPVDLPPGHGLDVRPHPHIGLCTVTYLFEGGQIHRDSLGSVQEILPGAVNWMTAGRGIVHSERTSPQMRAGGHRMHGVQSWVALPADDEMIAPSFEHAASETLPVMDAPGIHLRLLAGHGFGLIAPVRVLSPLFYADVAFASDSQFALGHEHQERAMYVVSGSVGVGNQHFGEGMLVVFDRADEVIMAADQPARVLLFGGAPLDGPRHLWWNFVATSTARIEQAKADWRAMRLGRIPGDDDFIPLPD
jgi:redox-sensitive bicupin YhaK (pirin superfamily)